MSTKSKPAEPASASPAPLAEAPAKRKRTTKPVHALVAAKQAELIEAKKLGKVYDLIPELGEWACNQIVAKAQQRLGEIGAAETGQ